MNGPDPSGQKKNRPPELLAPAGTLGALIAGLRCGADAVYAGASRFGARAYAGNFSDAELVFGIDMAHALGAAVHVTMNTLYKDEELDAALALAAMLYQEGADAIIVQDIGFLSLVRDRYPDMPLHASTQMTVHNSYYAMTLKEMGVSRVVAARENSIEELKRMKETGIDVETFIHGALCICYSGQCLFSGIVGGRSGNRGRCAQPCRKKYDVIERDGPDSAARTLLTSGKYLLSPRDLNASASLFALIDAGIDSFKIEGRMKKPEYVAGVVSVYREAIDRYLKTGISGMTDDEMETLRKIFNRDFTQGYFFGNPNNALMSRHLPYNRGLDIGRVADVNAEKKEISVLLSASLSARDGIAVGDLEKKTIRSEDPRAGSIVRKMYSSGQICDTASAGDIVNIPADVFFSGGSLPAVGDPVYKTLDDHLHREIDRKMPQLSEEDIKELIRRGISSADLIDRLGPGPRLIPVHLSADVRTGNAIVISVSDDSGTSVSAVSDYIAEPAQKNPFSAAKGEEMLSALGTTGFEVSSARVSVTGDNFVPVGVFKELRNKALRAFIEKKTADRKRSPAAALRPAPGIPSEGAAPSFVPLPAPSAVPAGPAVTAAVYSADALKAALSAGAERVYVGGDRFVDPLTGSAAGLSADDIIAAVRKEAFSPDEVSRIWFRTPSVTKDADVERVGVDLEKLSAVGVTKVLVSNPGVLFYLTAVLKRKDIDIMADSSFNVFNAASARCVCGMGACGVVLSHEMSLDGIGSLMKALRSSGCFCPTECLVHGRIRLMVTEHPLIENACLFTLSDLAAAKAAGQPGPDERAGGSSAFRYFLRDMKGFEFPVLTDEHHRTHIFNSRELSACDLVPEIREAGVSFFRIDTLGCSAAAVSDLIRRYRTALDNPASGRANQFAAADGAGAEEDSRSLFTRGNFLREII